MIKYLDLKTVTDSHLDEIKSAVNRVIDSGWYLLGAETKQFENDYAHYIGSHHCISTGNGLDALSLIFKAYIEIGAMKPGDEIIVPEPAYANYMAFAISAGAVIRTIATTIEEGFSLPKVEKFEELINEHTRAILICNPNNPTGKVFDKAELTALISKHSDICFVIDQSYEDFTLKPLLSASEAAEFPNVILLHSLTKRFSIPGLRLGYVTASSALLQRIRMKRMPWSVNALAIEAGKYLLNKTDNLLNIEEYLLETDRLATLLQKTGCFDVWPTDTHYLLAKLRIGKASALKDYLAKEHGMLIRNASNFEGLDDSFIRIAAQTPEQNNALVSAIDCYLTKN